MVLYLHQLNPLLLKIICAKFSWTKNHNRILVMIGYTASLSFKFMYTC